MLALARLYLTMDDLDSCQQQCVQLLKMDSENDAATVVSTSIDVPYASDFSVFFCAVNQFTTATTFTPEIAVRAFLVTRNKNFISSQVQFSTRLFLFLFCSYLFCFMFARSFFCRTACIGAKQYYLIVPFWYASAAYQTS